MPKLSHLYCRLVTSLPTGLKNSLKQTPLVVRGIQPALVRIVEFFDFLPGRLRHFCRFLVFRLQTVVSGGLRRLRLGGRLGGWGRRLRIWDGWYRPEVFNRVRPGWWTTPPLVISQRPCAGPLVSVIVTCYNYGAYLDAVLGCLRRQSCQDFEIILIDDGSTDPATVARVRELAEQPDPKLTVIRQANQGVIAARNHAIARARGRYIFPLDADDTIEKTFLEKCLFFLENSPAHVFVYTWTHSTGAEDFIWPTRDSEPLEALEENRMGYAVFRREAFARVGGYNPVMAEGYEDWELCVNLVAHGYCGRVIREPLYNYYVKPGARNYHAIKKHAKLRRKINALHAAALCGRRGILTRQARQPFRVANSLVNLAPARRPASGSQCCLIDFYREQRGVRVDESRWQQILAWAAVHRESRIILFLGRPQPELFTRPQPSNLFVYYPEEYHPLRDAALFYLYMERCYRPVWIPLRRLEKR